MLAKTMTLKAAMEVGGKVSNRNSKMPGTTFAISPSKCLVGGKLAKLKGSVCHRCYALKFEKMRPSVRMGYASNFDKAVSGIANDPVRWAEAVAFQINHYAINSGVNNHRWFDAGDLQSVAMLYAICLVCELTPNVDHWLPTREAKIVDEYMATYGRVLPSNLTVRVSSVMIGDKPIMRWANTSTVHRKDEPAPQGSHVCPASKQGGSCGECRACWSRDVINVSYPLH